MGGRMLMESVAECAWTGWPNDRGIRSVTFANGDIVHLRPSGNAPELRCYAEADTQERAQDRCNACLQRVLSSHAAIVSEAIQGVAAK